MTNMPKQPELMPDVPELQPSKVECLGKIFDSDNERREYFILELREALEELKNKLAGIPFTTVDDVVKQLGELEKWDTSKWQHLRELVEQMRVAAHGKGRGKDLLQLWKDEVGFPHGEIEEILRLSDPPYYTPCPNPFIGRFVATYGTPYDPNSVEYRREPFATDVSEGKSDPIYNAHGYHTKVPHKAIMRYILHYTNPGDVVLDGFSGTGMTGVAALLCGSKDAVEDLGYRVLVNKDIVDLASQKVISKLGVRQAILTDISTAATFISYNYSYPPELTYPCVP